MKCLYRNLTNYGKFFHVVKNRTEKLNKDGKKSMRKTLSILLVVLVGLCMITSCNPESKITENEELVSVRLVEGQEQRKGLTATLNFDISSVQAWKYTAVKADSGIATGKTNGTGESNAVALKGNKGDGYYTENLSQGYWNFELFGYSNTNTSADKLICYGKVDKVLITKASHEVTISVTPKQEKTGTIVVESSVTIQDATNKQDFTDSANVYTKVVTVYDSTGKTVYGTDGKTTTDSGEQKLSSNVTYSNMKSGVYKVVVSFIGNYGDTTRYTAATATKYINVYDNLTTTVSGNMIEGVQAADIKTEVGTDFSAEATISVSSFDTQVATETNKKTNSEEITVTLAAGLDSSSTAATGAGKSEIKEVTATFPANSIVKDATGEAATKDVTFKMSAENLVNQSSSSDSSTSSDTTTLNEDGLAEYQIETAQGAPVAKVTLGLEGASLSSALSNADDSKANAPTGSVYVGKGLATSFASGGTPTLGIQYIGGGTVNKGEETNTQKPELLSYDSTTGMLEYRVYHFSDYAIYAPKYVAMDSNGNLSETLDEAINKVAEGATITLWNAAELKEDVTTNKSFTINLSGRKVTASTDKKITVSSGTITVKGALTEGQDALTFIEGVYTKTAEADTVNGTYSAKVVQVGEDKYYATLAAAIDAAETGSTLTLLQDMILAETITISNKTLTLDLKGKVISPVNGHTVVLEAGTADTTSKIMLTVKNAAASQKEFVDGAVAKAELSETEPDTSSVGYYSDLQAAINAAKEDGTVTLLENVDISNTLEKNASISIAKGLTLEGNGHVVYNTSNIKSSAYPLIQIGPTDNSFINVDITIRNLTIKNTGDVDPTSLKEGARLINIWNIEKKDNSVGGSVTFENVEIDSSTVNTGFRGISTADNKNATITFNKVTLSIPTYYAINEGYYTGDYILSNTNTTFCFIDSTIEGYCTINNWDNSLKVIAKNSTFNSINSYGKDGDNDYACFVIYGTADMSFDNCTLTARHNNGGNAEQDIFSIRGYSDDLTKITVNDNCTIESDTEDYDIYSIGGPCVINGKTWYVAGTESLDKAFLSAEDGSTIILLGDVSITNDQQLTYGKSFILDLNNKTMSLGNVLNFGYDSSYKEVVVSETIKNGTVKVSNTGYIRFGKGSTGIFENVTFESSDGKFNRTLQTYAQNGEGKNVYTFTDCAFTNTYLSFEGGAYTENANEYAITFKNCAFTANNATSVCSSCISTDYYVWGSLTLEDTNFTIVGSSNYTNINTSACGIRIRASLSDTEGRKVAIKLKDVTVTATNAYPYCYNTYNYNGNSEWVATVTEEGTNTYTKDNVSGKMTESGTALVWTPNN